MRVPLLALFLLCDPASAGTWTRVDKATVKFEGDIIEGEYDRFAGVYDGNVKELIVNSPGGLTDEGIKIGLVLAGADIKVTVIGECLSSCANYLFVGGHRREIRGGIVGFHGNVKACFGSPARRAKLIEEYKDKWKMSDKDIKDNLARLDAQIVDEARFLQIMGVDQALFDRSCTSDKGRNDGKSYAFFLPKKATFEQYRIYGVVGEQDPAVIAALPFPVAVD